MAVGPEPLARSAGTTKSKTQPVALDLDETDAALLKERLCELAAVQERIGNRLDNLHNIFQAMIASARP